MYLSSNCFKTKLICLLHLFAIFKGSTKNNLIVFIVNSAKAMLFVSLPFAYFSNDFFNKNLKAKLLIKFNLDNRFHSAIDTCLCHVYPHAWSFLRIHIRSHNDIFPFLPFDHQQTHPRIDLFLPSIYLFHFSYLEVINWIKAKTI